MFQSLAGHIKYADLIGGAVTVLHGAQHAVRQGLVALKVQHSIHNVLHDFGTRNGTVFVDMADNKGRYLIRFCHIQEACRAFLDLADCAGGRRHIRAAHRLDGVDHYKIRLHLFNQPADFIHIAFRHNGDIILRHIQPNGTQLDLPYGFFARHIQNRARPAYFAAQLQQNGRFADARFAANQNHTAQHNATAQHAVQLCNASYNAAFFFGRAYVFQFQRFQAGLTRHMYRRGSAAGRRLCRFFHHIFGHRVPCTAGRAAAQPAGTGFAALVAHINCFQLIFWHGCSPGRIFRTLLLYPKSRVGARYAPKIKRQAAARCAGDAAACALIL